MNEKSEKSIPAKIEGKYFEAGFDPAEADSYTENARLSREVHYLYLKKMMKSLRNNFSR